MDTFLRDLLITPGPSGVEDLAVARWLDQVSSLGPVDRDQFGNAWVTVGSDPTAPTILIAAHIDEIGLMIHYIDDNGFLYVKEVGGWDPMILTGQRVQILTESGGIVFGVVGRMSAHYMTEDEQEEPISVLDLWLDIGAKDREEAEQAVSIGDIAVIHADPIILPNNQIASKAVDNRIGCYIVAKTIERYALDPGRANVIGLITAQEETTGYGLRLAARHISNDLTIVVDAGLASDHPGLNLEVVGERSLGDGAMIGRGGLVNPAATRDLASCAEDNGIPANYEAVPSFSDTDMDLLASDGVPVVLVGYPIRYAHTPVETVSMDDVEACIDLLHAFCQDFS